MQCSVCQAELPDDAQFCIECGNAVKPHAETGATIQLRPATGTALACPVCRAANPEYASFCVQCGHRLDTPAVAERVPEVQSAPVSPQSTPTMPPIPHRGGPRHRHGPRHHGRPGYRGRSTWMGPFGAGGRNIDHMIGPIFLIGLGILFFTKLWWPGIFLLIGIIGFLRETMAGRIDRGLRPLIWMFGFYILFTIPRLFLPGLFVLIGLNILLEMVWRRSP
jgi:hypothetical protein